MSDAATRPSVTDPIDASWRIFASPDSVDSVATSYVELLNAVAAEAGAGESVATLGGIVIHCDGCGVRSEHGEDARAALNLAQAAGWLHDFSDHSDLCPDCRKDRA